MLVGTLHVVSLKSDLAQSTFSLFIGGIDFQSGFVLFLSFVPALCCGQRTEHLGKFKMESWKLWIDFESRAIVFNCFGDIPALCKFMRYRLMRARGIRIYCGQTKHGLDRKIGIDPVSAVEYCFIRRVQLPQNAHDCPGFIQIAAAGVGFDEFHPSFNLDAFFLYLRKCLLQVVTTRFVVPRAPLRDAEQSLNLPQPGLQFQRGAKLRYRIRIRALEELQHAKVAACVHVIGIECNNGLKLECRELRIAYLQEFRSLASMRYDLLLTARTRLGETRQHSRNQNRAKQDSNRFCPHITILRRTSGVSRSSHAKRRTAARRRPSLS